MTDDKSAPANAHRIVIVGGGAGGLPLAAASATARPRAATRASRWSTACETHVWKPLLHEVAAGRMDAAAHDVDYLALAHWHRFRFRQGALAGLDRARREITLGAGAATTTARDPAGARRCRTTR